MAQEDQQFSFLAPHFEEQEVNGKKLKFYAVSTRTLFKLKVLASPIAKSLVTIMSGKSQDIKRTSRDFQDTTTGDLGQETVLEPVSVNMVKLRDGQKATAIEELIEAITKDENRYIVGELICDSLREEFPDRPVPQSTVQACMDNENMTLPTLVEIVGGVINVNKGAFGPLAAPLAAKIKAEVDKKLASERERESEETEEEKTE
ncbi:MAG: hypothetical protein GY906_12990 [bacterium]|nr:hypothetical protein [bacterium]